MQLPFIEKKQLVEDVWEFSFGLPAGRQGSSGKSSSFVKRMREVLDKLKKYVKKEVEELK